MSEAAADPIGYPVIEWEDGYPTDASLEAFRALGTFAIIPPIAGSVLRRELTVCANNCCASYDEQPGERYGTPVIRCSFSTGGWSGAEELIAALLAQFWITHLHAEWKRGGHYVFEVSQPKDPHDAG
jgi:hypothetical protein